MNRKKATTPREQQPSWVPVDACTLSSAELPDRLREFDDVFTSALLSIDRREPEWLRLDFLGGEHVGMQLRDLTSREAACCEFFDFSVHLEPDRTVLDIRVEPARADVLTGMEEQARAAVRAREAGGGRAAG